jgi:hypothetical protein
MSTFEKRILGFALGGALVATLFVVWVTFLRLTAGTAAFARAGVTYPATVALYYVALPLGGVAVGTLWGLRRHLLGAILIGVACMIPLYFGVAIIERKAGDPWLPDLRSATILSVIIGGAVGVKVWWDERKDRSEPDERKG